jgi:threonine aldolase
MKQHRFFASDNSSPVHPSVLDAIKKANIGHEVSYGDDPYTEEAISEIQRIFGEKSTAFFVYNGTGANVLGMQAATRQYNAIICTDVSHINTDECGAPEAITGAKLLPVSSDMGKLTAEDIDRHIALVGVQHHSQPSMVSLTQSTELGTVYRVEELSRICSRAHQHGLLVHVDGARLANAAAFLGCGLREITTDVGVDVLSFGATKNGIMFGESVVFLRQGLSEVFPYIRKQGMQLASKMRYIAAQFTAILADGLWLENARHANRMAKRLETGLADIDELQVLYPVEANALFVRVPKAKIPALQEQRFFYVWEEEEGVVRWMTSFDTTEEDVDDFLSLLRNTFQPSA